MSETLTVLLVAWGFMACVICFASLLMSLEEGPKVFAMGCAAALALPVVVAIGVPAFGVWGFWLWLQAARRP